jgi:LmbE family N-acetylglucosaminyl deacetylase
VRHAREVDAAYLRSLGGQLPRMNVTLVHVTDGAPMNLRDAHAAGFTSKEEYARARRLELLAAMSLAGIPEPRCIALNIGDQEASFRLRELTLRIAELLQTLQPALVFTHPYEGGHPDHDASSFAVHSALKLLRPKQTEAPLLFEFTSYHAGPKGMETDFLPNSRSSVQQLRLGQEECALKVRMLECFATQKHMVSQFPIAKTVDFRDDASDRWSARFCPRFQVSGFVHTNPTLK